MSDWEKIENPLPEDQGNIQLEEHSLPEEGPSPEQAVPEEAPSAAPSDAGGWTVVSSPVEGPVKKPRKKRSDAGVPRRKRTPPPEKDEGTQEERPEPLIPEEAAVPHRSRYGVTGRRRGQRRYAAPLGFLVLALAVVGVVSLAVMGIQAIRNSQDDTELREEIMEFLEPVTLYNPAAFSDINDNPQDALLEAAVWKVTEKERIRQLQEKDEVCAYSLDDLGRMIVPQQEIILAYDELYGSDAQIYHHTVGEAGSSVALEYDEANQCYHVPFSALGGSSSSLYVPVLDTLTRRGDTLVARIGYVPAANIAVDDRGNEIAPTIDMATSIQLYTLKERGATWKLVSIEDDNG